MEASRKRLFRRGEPEHPLGGLDVRVLLAVARLGLATGPHVQALEGLSPKAARNHLRNLYDHGLLERSGVTRSQLATTGHNDLLFGSAPMIYTLSKDGLKAVRDGQYLSEQELSEIPTVNTKSFFVAHDLLVRDVRAWLARVKRMYPEHRGILDWAHGQSCMVPLPAGGPYRECRPDARFTYGLKEATLAAFVEADRGTETSPIRWEEKAAQYGPLLSNPELVFEQTGQRSARMLVVAPDAARRDWIAAALVKCLPATGLRPDRFCVAEAAALENTKLDSPVWRLPGVPDLRPLVPAQYL